MGTIFNPNAGCLQDATEKKTALAGCKIALFKSDLVPSVTTTKADCDAAEADYDGYVAGGKTVTAWSNPILDPAGGAGIESGLVQFEYVDSVGHVGNILGGFYIVDAAGHLRTIGTFDVPIPLNANGQGIPLNVKLVSATGQGF